MMMGHDNGPPPWEDIVNSNTFISHFFGGGLSIHPSYIPTVFFCLYLFVTDLSIFTVFWVPVGMEQRERVSIL